MEMINPIIFKPAAINIVFPTPKLDKAIGKPNVPRVAPKRLTVVAKPTAVPRISVGNNSFGYAHSRIAGAPAKNAYNQNKLMINQLLALGAKPSPSNAIVVKKNPHIKSALLPIRSMKKIAAVFPTKNRSEINAEPI